MGNEPLRTIAKWLLTNLSCRCYSFYWSCILYNAHVNLEETPGWSLENNETDKAPEYIAVENTSLISDSLESVSADALKMWF